MGYCSVQDLEAYYLGKTFKCGDYLTNGKAQELIATDAAWINARLKTRYTLPFTDTNDLLILKMINEKMVVGTIDDVFREKTEDGRFERGRNTRKEALDFLQAIVDGDVDLDGSAKDSVIKFNTLDSNGNVVEKRFKDSNIEPVSSFRDLESQTIVRVNE